MARIEELLQQLYAGELPAALEKRNDPLLQALAWHGLLPLAWEWLSRGQGQSIPPWLRDELRKKTLKSIHGHHQFDSHLKKTLDLLGDAGITPLLMKGAALGQSHYTSSGFRPRCDNDLLIRESDRKRVTNLLLEAGFRKGMAIDSGLVRSQDSFIKEEPADFPNIYDVHYKISNRRLIANAFTYEELRGRAVEVPSLGKNAWALASVDALLLACIHRVAHHIDFQKMIWLYDIHLLVESLNADEFSDFCSLAKEKQVTTLCRDGVERSQRLFSTSHLLLETWLAQPVNGEKATSAFLVSRHPMANLISEARALGGWRDRIRLLKEHMLPSSAYMQARYGVRYKWLLPTAYLWRAAKGAKILLTPRSRRDSL